ncbi:zf-TFIIB domain-containing protein [Marinobacter salicampi]|uniref:TFIIB-type zinc ribbon-containing protein n=1 Tax=Marinobacter salicampi TaxID=435907 RepID=UPI00140958C9|nr:zf-TFIIB domain-containing protein [Marinobacter salicampi]
MKCPICIDEHLVMADRQGIEIDYCPKCRGVWLDRGELDKIIERTAVAAPQAQAPQPQPQPQAHQHQPQSQYPQGRGDYREPPRYADNRGYQKKKKGGLLGELFDF